MCNDGFALCIACCNLEIVDYTYPLLHVFIEQILMNVRAAICAIHWPTVLTFLEAMTAPVTQDTPGMASLAVQVYMPRSIQ